MISATKTTNNIRYSHQQQHKWDTLKVQVSEEILVIAFSVEYKMNRSSLSNKIKIDCESRVKARVVVPFALSFPMKGRSSEWWNVRHPFDEMTFRNDVDA